MHSLEPVTSLDYALDCNACVRLESMKGALKLFCHMMRVLCEQKQAALVSCISCAFDDACERLTKQEMCSCLLSAM